MDQRRADAFTDILLGGERRARGGSPAPPGDEVQVVVDAEVLAGVSDKPGELVGYGAITASHARELAQGDARWRRLLTDPTGRVVEVNPRPTALDASSRALSGRAMSFAVSPDVAGRRL